MPILRTFLALAVWLMLAVSPATLWAQGEAAVTQGSDVGEIGGPAADTGGRQTLDDILRRQRGETVDDSARRGDTGAAANAAGIASQLGTLGGASDAEVYRAIRFGTADVKVSARNAGAGVLIQDGGMRWLEWRRGPLAEWGGWLLLDTLALLALFLLLRGRMQISGEWAGVMIPRFTVVERFSHWLLAGSFLLLAITGLITMFGRPYLISLLGKPAYATLATGTKWTHDNVSWAFMLGLIMVTVLWLFQNLPNRHDVIWLLKGGGVFSKDSHVSAGKFNAGQKIIFWVVVILGVSISLSGLSLLFPYDMPLFAPSFGILNDWGVPGWFGMAPFPDQMAPQEEMQYAQLWHAAVGFVFMAVILAHIYLGTVGMEGSFDAMGRGEVDAQWAKEHHDLWYEEVTGRDAHAPTAGKPDAARTPAE
ncbi:formate dehydrogenase subunit gamma [Brevirhabdus sp.]|uniref:formate dehydrogenase subunit gamma n=1 Tax=Brevirhabdus sp. TaxID=2004514 RepID=UPI004058F448